MAYPNDAVQAVNYRAYGSHNDFLIESGVCVLPLAEEPPIDLDELALWSPVVIARLHAPYRLRSYKYQADKQNNPPPTPLFGDVGAFIFIGGTISIANTLNATYANYDWMTSSEYLYVENCVIRPQDGLVLGSPPYSQVTVAVNAQNYPNIAPTPAIGAISYAGIEAVLGYWQGQAIINSIGNLNNAWGYNVDSYYPGTLFYSDLANGGPTLV